MGPNKDDITRAAMEWRRAWADRPQAGKATDTHNMGEWRDAWAMQPMAPTFTTLAHGYEGEGHYDETMAGGVVVGGAALEDTTYNVTASGGALGGGAVVAAAVYDLTTSGGVLAGGAGAVSHGYIPTGGVLAGGSSDDTFADVVEVGGGVVLAGTSVEDIAYTYNETMTGGAVVGAASFANGYRYRRLVTVPAGAVGSDLYGFLLGVRLTVSASHVLTGTDFQVEDTSGNRIYHELRSYSSGTAHIFWQADLLTASDNDFYVYYGRLA